MNSTISLLLTVQASFGLVESAAFAVQSPLPPYLFSTSKTRFSKFYVEISYFHRHTVLAANQTTLQQSVSFRRMVYRNIYIDMTCQQKWTHKFIRSSHVVSCHLLCISSYILMFV